MSIGLGGEKTGWLTVSGQTMPPAFDRIPTRLQARGDVPRPGRRGDEDRIWGTDHRAEPSCTVIPPPDTVTHDDSDSQIELVCLGFHTYHLFPIGKGFHCNSLLSEPGPFRKEAYSILRDPAVDAGDLGRRSGRGFPPSPCQSVLSSL